MKKEKSWEKFARDSIKNDLALLPESNQLMFKRMYSHENLHADINDAVDKMPVEKLGLAMDQVERTLANRRE